ncbi:hypothetical protein Droror1_Dr00020013 [Drosera rotundifolia]
MARLIDGLNLVKPCRFSSSTHQSKQLGLGFPRSTEFMHDASRGGEIFVVIKLENSGGDLVNREEGFEGECYRLVFNFGRSVRICSGSNDSVQISLGKVWPSLRTVMTANDEEARVEAVAKFKEVSVLLEGEFMKNSKGKPFFDGDEIGYVDIAFGAFTGWFKMTEKAFNVDLFDEATTPNLFAWVDAFLSHPAVKDFTPSTDKLQEFAKSA